VFANRFTILADASSLVGVLRRNLLLSLAAADFFRLRWSERILDETERAIVDILTARGVANPAEQAARSRAQMEVAFEDAVVGGYDALMSGLTTIPDPDDAHVIAAAVKTRASVIVTENIKHFPSSILAPLDLEAKTADEFIADTISLDPGRSVAALRVMRERFARPELSPQALLLKVEGQGLTQTADALKDHILSL
jgi:predicted nucleic acid-binding protein